MTDLVFCACGVRGTSPRGLSLRWTAFASAAAPPSPGPPAGGRSTPASAPPRHPARGLAASGRGLGLGAPGSRSDPASEQDVGTRTERSTGGGRERGQGNKECFKLEDIRQDIFVTSMNFAVWPHHLSTLVMDHLQVPYLLCITVGVGRGGPALVGVVLVLTWGLVLMLGLCIGHRCFTAQVRRGVGGSLPQAHLDVLPTRRQQAQQYLRKAPG